MSYFVGIVGIMVATIITNNVVLSQSLAICPFLGVSKKMKSAVGMSLAVIFVVVIAALISYVLNVYVLAKLNIEFLSLIVNILVIAALVQLLEILIKRFIPTLYKGLGVYLPLLTTNCAVLAVANSVMFEPDAFYALMTSLGTGLGFMLAIVLMAGIRERIDRSDITPNFKGFPITLLAAGLIAMAFAGLAGLDFFLFIK